MAMARARRVRTGVTVGQGVRFGPKVCCRAAPGGSIVIGRDVEIAGRASLIAGAGASLVIGDDVFIGPHTTIAASGRIVVGAGSMLAESVTIRDHDHDPTLPPRSGDMLQGDIFVGARVWIAAKASVGRGVTIGDDVVVGAHAFVNNDVPPDCLAAGVPARVKRTGIKRAT